MSFKQALLVLFLIWEVSGQNVTCPDRFGCPKGPLSCLSYHSRDNIYSIPSPLAPSLTRIQIRYQNITSIKVGDFPLLKSLGSMRIQDSRVASIQSESFATLPCLMELDLTGNNIRKLEPDTFKALHNLRIMQLSRNRIHSVDQTAFAGLPKLKTLGLNNNCLFSIPRSIALLKSLRHLSFLNNIKTSPIRVEELSSLPVSDLAIINKIGCDCRERAVKRWLLGSPHTLMWRVVCIDEATRQTMRLKDIPRRDLTCPALRVSVTLENRGENGIEAICQTNCEDALTFSWILPNGEHSSSSYEYSTNSTHIRTRRPVSEENDRQGVRMETHYENDDQFPETNPDRHYENDDRFPETNGECQKTTEEQQDVPKECDVMDSCDTKGDDVSGQG
ncbi:PREDICTED: slit homolog 1 protein-like [Branchiostoma belcheri]|uniref:Slit homolog 1 protein-like n=1 Tax=Branchiostoma belcheri TaxID=7741 RepID=A0A6P5A827_BRABE|nr:PREDICTED: slit homolog 1 protein-like [Branchiostoma belcheri]